MRPRGANATAALVLAGIVVAAVAAKPGPASAPRAKAVRTARARGTRPAHPDFSGTWKLSMTRSSLGKTPGQPRARTDVIEHRDPRLLQTLYMEFPSHKDTTVYRYLIDSTESVNRAGSQEIKARAWWAGQVLSIDSRARILVLEATLKDRWSVSADGKALTMRRHIKSVLGEDDQILVFEKQ